MQFLGLRLNVSSFVIRHLFSLKASNLQTSLLSLPRDHLPLVHQTGMGCQGCECGSDAEGDVISALR